MSSVGAFSSEAAGVASSSAVGFSSIDSFSSTGDFSSAGVLTSAGGSFTGVFGVPVSSSASSSFSCLDATSSSVLYVRNGKKTVRIESHAHLNV